jgi:hypothetical protein
MKKSNKELKFPELLLSFIKPFLRYSAELSANWQLCLSQVLFQNNKWKFDV